MIINQITSAPRPQKDPAELGAQFRALCATTAPKNQGSGTRTEEQILRARSSQRDQHDTAELPYWNCGGYRRSFGESRRDNDTPAENGTSVADLLAGILIESARKATPATDHWRLVVPLERTRFPDSSALISAKPDSIDVQFRSYHWSVVSTLGPVVDTVGLMARQGTGRPVMCEVRMVETLSELYR